MDHEGQQSGGGGIFGGGEPFDFDDGDGRRGGSAVEGPFAGLLPSAPGGLLPFRSPSEPPASLHPAFFAPQQQQQQPPPAAAATTAVLLPPISELAPPTATPTKKRSKALKPTPKEAPAALQTARRQHSTTEIAGIVVPLPQNGIAAAAAGVGGGGASPPVIGIPSGVALKPATTPKNFDPIQFPARIPLIGLLDQEQQAKLNKILHAVVNQLIRVDTARLFHDVSQADSYPIVIDLRSIRDRIREVLYHSLAELAADVRLMVANAKKFFEPETRQSSDILRFEAVAMRSLEKQRSKMDPLLVGDFSMVYSMTFDDQQQQQRPQPASPGVVEVTLASGEAESEAMPALHVQRPSESFNPANCSPPFFTPPFSHSPPNDWNSSPHARRGSEKDIPRGL